MPQATIYIEVPVTVDFDFTPSQAGRLFGPPEDCYPSEPATVDAINDFTPDMADIRDQLESGRFDDDLIADAIRDEEDSAAMAADARLEEQAHRRAEALQWGGMDLPS